MRRMPGTCLGVALACLLAGCQQATTQATSPVAQARVKVLDNDYTAPVRIQATIRRSQERPRDSAPVPMVPGNSDIADLLNAANGLAVPRRGQPPPPLQALLAAPRAPVARENLASPSQRHPIMANAPDVVATAGRNRDGIAAFDPSVPSQGQRNPVDGIAGFDPSTARKLPQEAGDGIASFDPNRHR